VSAKNNVVTAMHPLAAEAGSHILRSGGNAVDAAVATGFAICVVEPFMASIGGVGYMLFHERKSGKTYSIDYGPRAPMDAWDSMYQLDDTESSPYIGLGGVKGQENVRGYRSVGVPGVVAGLCYALKRFGTLPIGQVLEPAIHYAKYGFQTNWHTTLTIASSMDLIRNNSSAAATYLPNQRPPSHWPSPEIFKQAYLADVLELLVKKGVDVFYKGDIAASIGDEFANNAGLLSVKDLERYQVACTESLQTDYRSLKIHAVPQANGSFTVLQALKVLSHFDLFSLGHNSIEYLHLIAETLRHVFADRYHFMGDPEFESVPMRGMLNLEYSKKIADSVSKDKTQFMLGKDIEPWIVYSDEAIHNPWDFEGVQSGSYSKQICYRDSDLGDCTTHFNVVDSDRNTVSCTQTAVSLFGSGIVVPDTGILMNNSMIWFNPRPGYVNSIAGYKRPLVNMSPLLATSNKEPVFALGAPGGRKIISAVLQVLLNIVDFNYEIQAAIEKPRIDASGAEILLDMRCGAQTEKKLRQLGHQTRSVEETPGDASFARPSGVMISGEDGLLTAGVDPFRIADAIGD
tara:strand:+ start:1899 stop:3614 length:1716 start_codon:yes stop_codon:yes gene_type:complete